MSRTPLRVAIAFLFRRPLWLALMLGGLASVAGLLFYAKGTLIDSGPNAAIDLAIEMLGAIITAAIIAPIIQLVQEGRIREVSRLDHDLYRKKVATARWNVQILTTFSNSLRDADRFFDALKSALRRNATVQILLLDPASLAVNQRQRELDSVLGDGDVRLEIIRNARVLQDYADNLDKRLKKHFHVKFYDASTSITFYRWDDRALVAFLPKDRLSEENSQLEVGASSQIGTFVGAKFRELWDNAKTLDEYMNMQIQVFGEGANPTNFDVRYVSRGGNHYVTSDDVLAIVMNSPGRAAKALLVGDATSTNYELTYVDGAVLRQELATDYREKYREDERIFIWLKAPETEAAPNTDTSDVSIV